MAARRVAAGEEVAVVEVRISRLPFLGDSMNFEDFLEASIPCEAAATPAALAV